MLEITNVKLSKNTVNAGEKYVISVDINEIIDYPYDFPYDFPVSCTRKAEPEKYVNAWKSEQDRKVLFLYRKFELKKEVRYMKMEQANYIKAIFTAVFAFISALLGVLAVPVILLVTCNLIDYATGLMASKYRSQDINSYKSIRGIFKKVSMWLLVVVGAIIDELLLYAATTIGKPMPVTFLIACVVAMWLICNEIISILENIQDMGVNIPAFLQPLVKHIRSQVEEQINIDKKEDKNSEDE